MPILTFVLTLALVLASCGADTDVGTDAGSGGTTPTTDSGDTSTSTTATTSSTTTTAPTSPTSTVPRVDATADPRCDDPSALRADVDGDGHDDVIVHLVVDGEATLRLCASTVGYQELDGIGQAEHLEVVDVEDDGPFEIFYGATTAGSLGTQVAVVTDDGELVAVNRPNGAPFLLTDGYPAGIPPDGPRLAFGCSDGDGDGLSDLTTARITVSGTQITAEQQWFAIRGDAVVAIGENSSNEATDGTDAVSAADAVADRIAPPC